MQTLIVNLSDRSYPIHVGAEIIERAGQLMQQAGLLGKVAIVTGASKGIAARTAWRGSWKT